ncbi:10586_t:CDS:2, partial [Funneliformis caledonium]
GKGDKGIDMRGRMHGEKFAGQCKAWRKNKIGPAVIRDMIGALANEPWFTIGVVKAGIIITDSDHLYDDLSVVAGPVVIREMIGALANEPWFTIGVVVGLSKDTFTSGAVKAAEEAGILITDSDHLYDDLSIVAGLGVTIQVSNKPSINQTS